MAELRDQTLVINKDCLLEVAFEPTVVFARDGHEPPSRTTLVGKRHQHDSTERFPETGIGRGTNGPFWFFLAVVEDLDVDEHITGACRKVVQLD